jgi:20S proteasome alpha/beta subunit
MWDFKKEHREVKMSGPREVPSGNAIGACNHGALYFAKEFQRDTMSLEQNMLIGFHCVAEVAKHDVRVDRPIDVLVVTPSRVTIYPESQLLEFVSRSREITATISSCFSAEGLKLPPTE